MRTGMPRHSFRIVAWLFLFGVTAQVLLAGLALFADPAHWSHHVQAARVIFFLPLVMVAIAYFARLEKQIIWRCLALVGIVAGLFFTAGISGRIGWIGALHPVIALILFWNAAKLTRVK